MRIVCDRVQAFTGDPAKPREWILLARMGVNPSVNRPFDLSEDRADAIVSEFNRRKVDLVIDYEHQTMGGDYSAPNGKAPAAGWVKELRAYSIADDAPDGRTPGIWGRVEWTAEAYDLIASKHYKYLSPVVSIDEESGDVLRLLNAALTNFPALDDAPTVSAKGAAMPEKKKKKVVLVNADGDPPAEGDGGGEPEAPKMRSVEELCGDIAEAVGVEMTGGPEEFLLMLLGMLKAGGGGAAAPMSAPAYKAAIAAKDATITALNETVAKLGSRLDSVEKINTEQDFDGTIKTYLEKGVISNAELKVARPQYVAMFKADRTGFLAILDARPPAVSQGRTPDGGPNTDRATVISKAGVEFEQEIVSSRRVTCTKAEWIANELRMRKMAQLSEDEKRQLVG